MASSNDETSAQPDEKTLRKLAKEIHQISAKTGPIVMCVANGKGGVGKTTISTNIAYEMSSIGLKVLAMGLCQQVDFADMFGLTDTDRGQGLVDAVCGVGQVEIHEEVRPNLDVIAGGEELMFLNLLSGANAAKVPGGDAIAAFQKVMLDTMQGYDVVVIDFPPGNPTVQSMGLSITDWVIAPTNMTKLGRNGLVDITNMAYDMIESENGYNSDIRFAGIVPFAFEVNATSLIRGQLQKIEELDLGIPIFKTSIRHSIKVASDIAERGILVSQLAEEARQHDAAKFERLRNKDFTGPTYSNATIKVADEFRALTAEILQVVCEGSK